MLLHLSYRLNITTFILLLDSTLISIACNMILHFHTAHDVVSSAFRQRRDYVNYARKLVEGCLEVEDIETEVHMLP